MKTQVEEVGRLNDDRINSSRDIEKLEYVHDEHSVSNEDIAPAELSTDHYEFLMKRHGSVQLDPLPSNDPLDPLNWQEWKKNYEIILIAFHCFVVTFMAAGLAPAYEAMSIQYGRSMTEISYFTSAQILCMGVLPLLFVPLMNIYGRRPFLMFSTLACCALNIGGGFCETYSQQMATRVLVSCVLSTGAAAGSCIVADTSFSHERGKKNGWWSLGYILGTPGGPFFMGFVQKHVGTSWIYYTFSIINFVQFIAYLFSRETVYTRNESSTELKINTFQKWLGLYKATYIQFKWSLFWSPFKQALDYRVVLVTIAATVTFSYANIVLIVETPQVFGPLFLLDAQQLSLQYISLIIGSIIGELLAGPLSDRWMKFCFKKRGGKRIIADRLWISYYGFLCVIVGLIIWGVYLFKAERGHWIITPLIGAAIAAAGNNIVTTVLIVYAIDTNPEKAADTGLFLSVIRMTFGFIGPFYFTDMFAKLNLAGASGLMAGAVFIFGGLATGVVHILGLRPFNSIKTQ